jgi:cell division protein FtsB
MNLVDIFARVAFVFSLSILLIGFLSMVGAVIWLVFRRQNQKQAPRPTVPETDIWYYRQRPRRAIQLLLDRNSQLTDELAAARQEIARLKGLRTGSNRR